MAEIWCLAIFTAIAPSSKSYIPQLPFRRPRISFFGQFFDYFYSILLFSRILFSFSLLFYNHCIIFAALSTPYPVTPPHLLLLILLRQLGGNKLHWFFLSPSFPSLVNYFIQSSSRQTQLPDQTSQYF
ncbi:hypothetical protein BJX96DRAFT_57448 [Aspergillus floccosus]